MDVIFILTSCLILLVPGFDDSVPPTGDKIFTIETHPDIVESMQIHSDESLDFWGFVMELKPNATDTLELKIPKNLPTPASFMHSSWYHNETPFVLVGGAEITFDIIEDSCYYQYNIPIGNKTSLEVSYSVITAGTWKLYSPIEFDKDHPCYNEVFDEKQINPPLEQFNSGIPFDEIQCKQNLVLVQKYDGSPACVTESTKTKLVERGWTGNAKRSIPDIEPTFLSKTISEWKSMPRKQLMDYHDNYHDNSFFSDLGRFLIKDAMKYEMEKHGIQNKYDDFTVYDEIMLTSLPPHAGFSAVVNATDQKTYLLGGSVFGNVIENGVHLRELVFYDILNSADSKDVELPYNKLLKTAPQVSISQDTDYIRLDPHIAIFDLEQSDSVVFHNDLKYLIRIQAYIPDDMDNTILKSGTISPNQTGTVTFENIGMYEYDVLGYPDNDSGLWEQKGGGEIIAISQKTKTLPLEEKLEIARSFLSYARDDIPFYSIGIGNGELRIGIQHSVEKSIPDYQEYYEKRIPQWIPFEIPVNVE